MNDVKVIGQMDNTIDHTFESANRVYDVGGIAPTMNTCGGGGLQPKILEVKQLGFMDNGTGKHQSNTVYDENAVCPNITTIEGSGTQQIKILTAEALRMVRTEDGKALRKQYENHEVHHGFNEYREPELRTDGGNTCPTITAQNQELCHIQPNYRIRKLTPRECGRLMGVSDEDISKMAAVNSNTQLYKQFGNSIVIDVMVAMFKNLGIDQKRS